jgi:uncharacterized membrane protein
MPYEYHTGAPAAPRNGLGTAALVLGIIGLLVGWVPIIGTAIGIILGIIAIVLGVVGRGRAKRGEASNGGVALGGLILGIFAIVIAIVAFVLLYLLYKEARGPEFLDCVNKAGADTAAQQQCQEQFERNLSSVFGIPTSAAR